MTRTLSDIIYREGNITSGKCTGCGQIFTTSLAAPGVNVSTEVALVGAFGGHECIPLKPIA
jgi:hypothetical protein